MAEEDIFIPNRDVMWYTLNSAQKKQAARSDICFLGAFNEEAGREAAK